MRIKLYSIIAFLTICTGCDLSDSFIRPPDIHVVVGGLIFYQGFFLSFFFLLFSPSNL